MIGPNERANKYQDLFLEAQEELGSEEMSRLCIHCRKVKKLTEFLYMPWLQEHSFHCLECLSEAKAKKGSYFAARNAAAKADAAEKRKKNPPKIKSKPASKKPIQRKPRRDDDPLKGVRVIKKGRRSENG